MSLPRREFLWKTGAGMAVLGGVAGSATMASCERAEAENGDEWAPVLAAFDKADGEIDMGALLIASHPRPVREAIEGYRRELDRSPTRYVGENNRRLQKEAREAAGAYLSVAADEIALTESTTMGLALLYGGLRLDSSDEILTTSNDYYVTHEALRNATGRSGARLKRIPLYEHGEAVSADELVRRITRGISRRTRLLALTWVHSSTGLKLPLTALTAELSRLNRSRDENDRVLVCVDGVHGFGVEDFTLDALGVDFFSAGCHKWLFGPRGTGLLWGREEAWAAVKPTIPSFVDETVWGAWIEQRDPKGPSTALRITPGGFKAFEHLWALPAAFEFQASIGKARVAARTHALARQLKEGLASMRHVTLITPMADELSAGIVCFDVDGLEPQEVVRRLRAFNVIGTVTPYATTHARLTPSIRNTEEEVEATLRAVRQLV